MSKSASHGLSTGQTEIKEQIDAHTNGNLINDRSSILTSGEKLGYSITVPRQLVIHMKNTDHTISKKFSRMNELKGKIIKILKENTFMTLYKGFLQRQKVPTQRFNKTCVKHTHRKPLTNLKKKLQSVKRYYRLIYPKAMSHQNLRMLKNQCKNAKNP